MYVRCCVDANLYWIYHVNDFFYSLVLSLFVSLSLSFPPPFPYQCLCCVTIRSCLDHKFRFYSAANSWYAALRACVHGCVGAWMRACVGACIRAAVTPGTLKIPPTVCVCVCVFVHVRARVCLCPPTPTPLSGY